MSVRSSEASFDRAGLPELRMSESDGLSVLVSLMFEMKKCMQRKAAAAVAADLAFGRKTEKDPRHCTGKLGKDSSSAWA